MATVAEVRRICREMSEDRWKSATERFPCDTDDRGYFAQLLIDRPHLYERKICDMLELPTEAERVTEATVQVARYAKLAFLATAIAATASILNAFAPIIATLR